MRQQHSNRTKLLQTAPAETVTVRPGNPLVGTVSVDGSTNAALPLLAAAAALDTPVRLSNLPTSTDVRVMLTLMRRAGSSVDDGLETTGVSRAPERRQPRP